MNINLSGKKPSYIPNPAVYGKVLKIKPGPLTPPAFHAPAVLPEGSVLAPLPEVLSHELLKRLENELDDYIVKRAISRKGSAPIPIWPEENKDWPLPTRFIYNRIIELTTTGSI
jgi:hypothetical protein